MPTLNIRRLILCLAASPAIAPAARAQWAVVDAPAIVQLIQEVQTMRQQLATAQDQLQSAQQALQAMTGDRGMEGLLSGTTRNYLPANWTQLTGALQGQGAGGYPGLSADVRGAHFIGALRCSVDERQNGSDHFGITSTGLQLSGDLQPTA